MMQEILKSEMSDSVLESASSWKIPLGKRDGLWSIQDARFSVQNLDNSTELSYNEMKAAIDYIEFEHSASLVSTVSTCLFDALDTFGVMGHGIKITDKNEFRLPIDFGSYVLGTTKNENLVFRKTKAGATMNLQIVVVLNLRQVSPYQYGLMEKADRWRSSQALVAREFKYIEFTGAEVPVSSGHQNEALYFNLLTKDLYFSFSKTVTVSNVGLSLNDRSLADFFTLTCLGDHYHLELHYPLNFNIVDKARLVMDLTDVSPNTHLTVFNLARVHYDPTSYSTLAERGLI